MYSEIIIIITAFIISMWYYENYINTDCNNDDSLIYHMTNIIILTIVTYLILNLLILFVLLSISVYLSH